MLGLPPPVVGSVEEARSRLRSVERRDEPCCRECGSTSPAVVDHITRVADGGAMFERSNLQRLCRSCASKKTARGE